MSLGSQDMHLAFSDSLGFALVFSPEIPVAMDHYKVPRLWARDPCSSRSWLDLGFGSARTLVSLLAPRGLVGTQVLSWVGAMLA